MPYTPPHRSPSASAPSSPESSRRPSLQSGERPSLPRSASYLTRHRRTPSAPSVAIQQTPPGTSDDLRGLASSRSVRQSPPPITDGHGIPRGAVTTPPESGSSGSEDEGVTMRGRKLENLKELEDAISQIPFHRESSPNRLPLAMEPKPMDGFHHSFSTGSLAKFGSRRSSHARSSTEPSVIIPKSADNSLTASDESESELSKKPQMVRKKSGELVRPALRASSSSRRRPLSMPGTPTFSKAVHFDAHLEHVRHFLQVDRPLAVSVGSSPVECYDSDTEYPFTNNGHSLPSRSPPFEWEILTSNFPSDSPLRKALPVRLERVWLSKDQSFLHGSVVVKNLAFQKTVVCRFTLDYWKTTSEVVAEYSHEVRPGDAVPDCDRFNFAIKLADMAHLENKTMFFCVRYNVLGREYWDNNSSMNFQVDFRKRNLPQNGKYSTSSRSPGSLPRSNHRRSTPNTTSRPKSMNDSGEFKIDKDVHEVLGESGPIKLRNRQSGNTPSDNLPGNLSPPRGQAFANRYDFGASLSAVKKLAKESSRDPDALYMRHHRRTPSNTPTIQASQQKVLPEAKPVTEPKPSTIAPAPTAAPQTTESQPGTSSPSTSLESSSYEDLVAKYCFYVPKQLSTPAKESKETAPKPATESSKAASRPTHHAGPALHHSLRTPSPVSHDAPSPRPMTPSAISVALTNSPILDYRSPSPSQKLSSQGSPSTIRSASPASIVGSFAPFTEPSPNDLSFHLQDRFPFSPDSHAATAIRG